MSLKVVYIDDNEDLLTKGKVYEVIRNNFKLDTGKSAIFVNQPDLYFIKHDKYSNKWFNKKLFLTIEQYRDNQIDKICTDFIQEHMKLSETNQRIKNDLQLIIDGRYNDIMTPEQVKMALNK